MIASTILACLTLLAVPVYAGSRQWEASVPLAAARNSSSSIEKRAISFKPSAGKKGHHTWPDKEIKFCFADAEARDRLRGPMEHAMQTTWGALRDLGFSYEEVSLPECDRDRINHLKVHYNDRGKLTTTIAKPVVDADWNRENPDRQLDGPAMHLSTPESIGMLDLNANVAHELGHAWGLYHEHQNPNFWVTSVTDAFPEDPEEGPWFNLNGQYPIFTPQQFNCRALSDYGAALERAKELEATGNAAYEGITAPFPHIADTQFDPDSIMLYPSGAGAVRPGNSPDGRQDVLTLADGKRMKPNVVPSAMDIERLRVLYSVNIADIKELHIRGAKKSTFEKIKSKLSRHGSARDLSCL
ncbi:uncharacterized protein J7T54_003776 [Emericellopsis cladophorae]|uniref:Peptidase metallopeptidase domain-containing protein n=1 Tax=Emericellopsis cladophorae TaxID=2686198 RepID=A0A9Q0BBJ1_9HYPO|nr:uncharacterized protein J7T54_003776 [Emericellopsis cladophorae]KAI6779852.1 hypothetical protein J7T54_003776 [Emericellopsis cladophorae]